MSRFPAVCGTSLEGREFNLPGDFEGNLNLVCLAFQQWHQRWVDTWLPPARELEAEYPLLRVYELPIIQRMNLLARTWIDWSMRVGIADATSRERTITLYLDKESFLPALQIPNEVTSHILLVQRDGAILWRSEGPYASEKAAGLRAALASSVAPPLSPLQPGETPPPY